MFIILLCYIKQKCKHYILLTLLFFSDAFYNSETDQRHLLRKMIKASNITLNVLVDYCRDTHFDLQQTAKLFLESCLIKWEPCIPDDKEEKTFGTYILQNV